VAQVQVYGSQKYAVRVKVDPKALASAGISLNDIQTSVAAANSNRPVGQLNGPKQNVTLQATPQLGEAAQYRPLIVAYRNGNPVRLGDVAEIIDGTENDKVASWFNGTRSVLLAVQRQPDANTIAVVDAVKALLPEFNAQLPPSVKLQVMLDRSQSIRESVHDVEFTLALTVGLVILVIFLFLRNLTATIIPAAALPISIVGTFAGMYLCGYSINNLTLLAITLSVGFVVDDAIVMLENIVRHVEKGLSPFQAALKGSREIGFTIVSITLSLVAVFIPVLFMGGIVGRLFREFAVTISMTILISGFVSLTLTPLMCSRLLKAERHDPHKKPNVLLRWSEAGFDGMLAAYRWSLDHVLRHRRLTLMATLATVVLTGYLYTVVPKGFFPTEDTGQLSVSTEAAQDISFEAMIVAQAQVEKIIRADPAIDVVNATVGTGGFGGAMNQGRLFIGLKPLKERGVSSYEVIQRLRPKLQQVVGINTYMQPIQNISVGGRSSRSLYQYTIQASDFDELKRVAPLMEAELRKIPGLQDVNSDLQIKSPQAMVDIDRDKAAALKVTADAIRATLYSAFGARQIATIYTSTNDYAVILEVDSKYQQDVSALSALYVPTTDGALVPLDTVARDLRDLRRPRHPLRELHPPDHHPVGPAVGGAGRAADPDAVRTDLSVIAIIGIVLLIGIVKKNAIMMIDFAISTRATRAWRPLRGDPRGLPAALPADHDDHHGRDHGRAADRAGHRRGRRAAPAAGPQRRRRPAGVAAPDALHHPGDLPLPRGRQRLVAQPAHGAARPGRRPASPRAGRIAPARYRGSLRIDSGPTGSRQYPP
jgi:HAE1 family hydrophobic/amphiphilic exporter-1